MDRLLLNTLIVVGVAAVASWLVSLVFGATAGWIIFAGGVLLLLIDHVRHVERLMRWLRQPTPGNVPEGRGIWDYVFARLYHFERAQTHQCQQLTKTLARFRQAGRALPDGVVILDADERIEWCNDTAEAHFGLDAARDAGQPIVNLLRQPEFVSYIESGNFAQALELRSPRGSRAILSVQIIPYGDAQKLVLSRDITRIEKLETTRRDFVANVSHELRTPLTVLTGFLETIRELKLDPERSRDYLNLMAEQTRRMQRIVDDLLMLSTLESAPGPAFDERVAIAPLLDRIGADANALSGGRHQITLDAEPGFDLLGAENEIASAFGNLVNNAIRYTPAGGALRVAWRASEVGATFAVEDTGIGIAAEHIPRLTERFYRVDRGRSRETGGTGLGLAIVKHVLSRHQATLEIASEPGKGSRFAAVFPGRRVVPAAAIISSTAEPRGIPSRFE